MSLEHSRPTEQGPSPWAQKQLRQFMEIADQVPADAPVIIRLPVTEALTGLVRLADRQEMTQGSYCSNNFALRGVFIVLNGLAQFR